MSNVRNNFILTKNIFAVFVEYIFFFFLFFLVRYWHRSLNPRKLIDVKFSHLTRNMTMQRTLKLYKLPEVCRYFNVLLDSVVKYVLNLLVNPRCSGYTFCLVTLHVSLQQPKHSGFRRCTAADVPEAYRLLAEVNIFSICVLFKKSVDTRRPQ